MMRGVSTWAVAVRKPDGEVEVSSEPLVAWAKRHRVFRWPVIRGVVALAESLKIGFRALAISANAQIEPEEGEEEPPQIGGFTWGADDRAVAGARGRPLLRRPGRRDEPDQGPARLVGAVLARRGMLRTAIFIGYLALISRLDDLRRVFEYHGAEHKTISCFEAGDRLTPARAERYSRLHPRCGTSFLLVVMVRRDLRLRPARPSGLVLAARLADPRHPPDRRASPTRSSSGRAATAASAGCGRSCGPGCCFRTSRRVSPTATSSRSRSRRWRRCSRSRTRSRPPRERHRDRRLSC